MVLVLQIPGFSAARSPHLHGRLAVIYTKCNGNNAKLIWWDDVDGPFRLLALNPHAGPMATRDDVESILF